MKICIVGTGETGMVIGSEAGGQYLVRLADGTTRAASGTEQMRVIPPDWSLGPSLPTTAR